MIIRTTISLTTDEIRQLKQLSKKEHRPMNDQILHMMAFYKKQYKEQ